jgi:hypothetical protein
MAFQPSPLIGEGPGQVLHERSDEGVGLLDLPLWASTNPVWMFGPATLEASASSQDPDTRTQAAGLGR